MTDIAVDPQIQELLDKQAIREVLDRYCRAVDRLDAELLSSVYHPDAVDDHHGRNFTGDVIGEGLTGWMREVMVQTCHHMTNVTIRLDGDTAGTEGYYIGLHHQARGGETFRLQTTGRYLDRFERRAGEWRIIERLVCVDSARSFPNDDEMNTGSPLWRRDPDDPSYRFVGGA